jgi:predicted lipid-binding transport protein (Tim44 family)
MRLVLFLLLLLAVVGILLATQESNFVPVSLAIPFLGISLTGSLFWMLAGWFGIGLLVGYLGTLPGRIGAAARARRAEKQLASVETTTASTVSAAKAEAAAARADARVADAHAHTADIHANDAAETQRLADEVARRTAARGSVPPPTV